MTKLSDRVAMAEGPSRELDAEIAALFRDERSEPLSWLRLRMRSTDEGTPYFSASLDAAMTLVPEGWNWGVGVRHDWRQQNAQVWHREKEASTHNGDAATPALALCAAALKSRGL